ncbi:MULTISPECIES: DUF992 domain-containing protein [Methylorubrum]|uniref:DUF992 domain-containing protein n=1 Tax=Methylorubrum TaxID=2282523 RepID=UPI00209D9E4C|nr:MULTISPECIES: DUF992 domain-containing protein [Methylorubrum]MCP1549111.1 hypothetical protein [Methylorubrum zatmanii]MCP1554276.1 hypothetical protein [Methylorubrum extorquens]MCP1579413.1 hypothetical protein [Methylorubrum extorquens]
MRTILAALVAMTLATAADARTIDATAEGRVAGTLTCETRTDLGLVFGTARVAACTFVTGDGRRQPYAALLPPREGEAGPRILAWRVITADGTSRPGLLDGSFNGDAAGALHGTAARLAPLDATTETDLRLAAESRTEIGLR